MHVRGPLRSHHMECSVNITFNWLIFFSWFSQKEAPFQAWSISPSLPCSHQPSLSLGLLLLQSAVSQTPQGFFTTSTTCCPDSQSPLSLSTWPPHCPLVDTRWGLLLAKNREGLRWCGVMGHLEIALGEGPGSEAGIEVLDCAYKAWHSAARKHLCRRHLCRSH